MVELVLSWIEYPYGPGQRHVPSPGLERIASEKKMHLVLSSEGCPFDPVEKFPSLELDWDRRLGWGRSCVIEKRTDLVPLPCLGLDRDSSEKMDPVPPRGGYPYKPPTVRE